MAAAATVDGYTFTQTKNGVDHYRKEGKRSAYWSDLRSIRLTLPLGYQVDGKFDFERIQEYFPVISFRRGYNLMQDTAESLTAFVVDANLKFTSDHPTENSSGVKGKSPLLQKHDVTHVTLTIAHRAVLGMAAVATYIRALIVFFQLGIVLVPFDIAAHQVQKLFQKA